MKHLYKYLTLAATLCAGAANAQDGTLDLTFNTTGTYAGKLSYNAAGLQSVAVQSDGKIVAVGTASSGSGNAAYDFLVARFNSNGTPDNSFGTNGTVKLDFNGAYDIATTVAIQPDGKIVVGGKTMVVMFYDFAIARLNSNGTPDNTFGTGGKATFDLGGTDEGRRLLLQPDGKILFGGMTSSLSYGSFAALRLNTDGTSDNSFGTGGTLTTPFTGASYITGMALLSNGSIVLSGSDVVSGITSIAVAKYNSAGVLDATFGTAGKVTYSVPAMSVNCNAMVVQADGKIVIGGAYDGDCFLIRYTGTGAIDNTFGASGKVSTDMGGIDVITSLLLQADGKIVTGGYGTTGSTAPFQLARYTSAGVLDAGFGIGGKVTTSFSASYDNLWGMALDGAGKIIAVGNTSSSSEMGIARYKNGTSTGIANTPVAKEAIVYPNPAGNMIRIRTGTAKVSGIRITAINGQTCLHTSGSTTAISVSHLPAGVYFIEATTNEGLYSARFIKE